MLRVFLALLVGLSALFLLSIVVAFVYGLVRPEKVRQAKRKADAGPRYGPVRRDQVAILIACRNGSGTIGASVAAARRTGANVYVVSDASSDDTVDQALRAGAAVLELTDNVGKPAALNLGYVRFGLGVYYRAIVILDDDVTVAEDFVEVSLAQLTDRTAIVVGHNVTWWPQERRWNVWLAKRAYSYWNYQIFIRRVQSYFNVMNCISGSNSLYRTELLDILLPQQPPYIVDDTYWVLETHRRGSARSSTPPGRWRSCRTRRTCGTGTSRTCAGSGAPSRGSSATGSGARSAASTTRTCC